jgi:glutamate synthase (NADPH/NADH) small chain
VKSDDQARILELGELCTQEDPPLCNASCPFHVDMRGVCVAAAAGDFKKGRAILEQGLALPRIMARLCEAPCQDACKYGEIGDTIATHRVADACMRFGAATKKRVFLPKRTQQVLVLGGGLGCFMAAVELAQKGFRIHVLYSSETPAGSLEPLIPDVLPQEAIDGDLASIQKLPVVFERVSPEQLDPKLYLDNEDYHTIFITDDQYRVLAEQGEIIKSDPKLRQSETPKVFCSGEEALRPSFLGEAFRAKQAAISMDRFMQGVNMDSGRESEGPLPTKLYTNVEGIEPRPRVEPAGKEYTEEEAIAEASRCINCQCLECVKGCAFMQHYNKYPKVFIKEFHNTLNFTLANRMHNIVINSCAECGQCKAICPYDCDMKEVTECSRRIMLEDEKMPPSAHEFALLDMQFSNSEEFFTVRHQPGHAESKYVFFPGCQLAATAPDSLRAAYEDLASRLEGGVGLILGCCGAIGEWAQRIELFQEQLKKITTAWEELGKPEFITACPTCYHIFQTFTEIPVTGIWQVLCNIGLPETAQKGEGVLSIHDSCGARNHQDVQDCVRELASRMGYEVEEPKFSGNETPCCGFGGLTAFANREIGAEMAAFAANRCEHRSLTYCANCRDRLAGTERPTVHVLELLYGEHDSGSTGFSLRRKNRLSVRAAMLEELWKEEVVVAEPNFKLIIPDKVQATMEDRMILESDLIQLFQKAEEDNSFILDVETGYLMASHRIGNVTFWAVFTKTEEGYVLENAYSYRMLAQEL